MEFSQIVHLRKKHVELKQVMGDEVLSLIKVACIPNISCNANGLKKALTDVLQHLEIFMYLKD